MDYAPIVTTALGAVFVLQIILIIQVSSLIKGMKNRKPEIPVSKPFRKDRIIPEGKKIKRPQTVESQKPASTVEKSLRDINLRLKNAERDQDKARRRLSTSETRSFDRDQDKTRKRFNTPDTRSFEKRPDRNGQKNSIKRRDGERKKPDFREKSSIRPREEKPSGTFNSSPPIKKEAPVEVKKQAPIPTPQEVISPEQSFGRGSKVTVKRRSLDEEKTELKISGENAGAIVEKEVQKEMAVVEIEVQKEPTVVEPEAQKEMAAVEPEAQKEQDVSFGRRSR